MPARKKPAAKPDPELTPGEVAEAEGDSGPPEPFFPADGSEAEFPAVPEPEPDKAAVTMADRMAQLHSLDLPDAAIMAALNKEFGGGDSAPPGAPLPGYPQQVPELGVDPARIAAYRERMANYVPPKLHFNFGALSKDDPDLRHAIMQGIRSAELNITKARAEALRDSVAHMIDGYGGVVLNRLMFDWCNQWRAWTSANRRMPPGDLISEFVTLETMVRFHWHAHPIDRALLLGSKVPQTSGPKAAFKADAGDWR